MSTFNPHPENDTGRTDPRDRYILLGVDSLDYHHLYRTTDETIHVVHGGERTHRFHLNPHQPSGQCVDDYVRYVRDRVNDRDWTHRWYYLPGEQPLADALTALTEDQE